MSWFGENIKEDGRAKINEALEGFKKTIEILIEGRNRCKEQISINEGEMETLFSENKDLTFNVERADRIAKKLEELLA